MAPKLGAVFPHGQIGADGHDLRAYAVGLEELGLRQLVVYDHVLGAGRATRPDWSGYYDSDDPFHEPLILIAHLAAITTTLEFATCVLILPQRQTALVAKQVAELQILSAGRLRLGVGLGWNAVEYQGLGVPLEHRATRMEEQIAILRALWTQPTIDVDLPFHRIKDAGINPRPDVVVPVWLGGGETAPSLDRIARLADGWMIPHLTPEQAAPLVAELHVRLAQHGRDRAHVGLEGRIYLGETPRGQWRAQLDAWAELGATQVNLVIDASAGAGVEGQLEALKDALDVIAPHTSTRQE